MAVRNGRLLIKIFPMYPLTLTNQPPVTPLSRSAVDKSGVHLSDHPSEQVRLHGPATLRAGQRNRGGMTQIVVFGSIDPWIGVRKNIWMAYIEALGFAACLVGTILPARGVSAAAAGSARPFRGRFWCFSGSNSGATCKRPTF